MRVLALESSQELEQIEKELRIISHDPSATEKLPPERQPALPPGFVRVTRPFTLVRDRAQLKSQVFQPSHRLPTMTVDEYLRAEAARGGIMPQTSEEPTGDPDDSDADEAVDRKTYKSRAWDLFTDDNPKGWGNTKNLG